MCVWYACSCSCKYKCGGQRRTSVSHSLTIYLVFWDGTSLNVELTFGLEQLASKPLGSVCLCPSGAGVTGTVTTNFYMGCWRFDHGSSSLHRKHFTLKPSPQSLFLIFQFNFVASYLSTLQLGVCKCSCAGFSASQCKWWLSFKFCV